MSEETAVAEAVPSTSEPVAVDPALLNKPVMPAQTSNGSADSDDSALKHKLGLANTHTKAAEKRAKDAEAQLAQIQNELSEIKNAQTVATQKSLESQGQYKQLWEDAKKSVSERDAKIVELNAQLASVTQDREQDRLRAASLSQINQAGAVNSNQMFQLLQQQLRANEEGKPVVLNGGVEQPLNDYLAALKNSADWQHHFGASGAQGMGAAAGGSVAPGRDNPYRSGNLTEAMRLEVENPDLAKALKAEARRG
tara:strand:+ start:854 stop:1612 length:759 start_codon:yes stop_codon:yes gene_type:complete